MPRIIRTFVAVLVFPLLVAASGVLSSASATLIGDNITATGNALLPTSATIGAGIEFNALAGLISGSIGFDFGASTLSLTLVNASGCVPTCGWGGFGNYTFSAFDSQITNVSLTSNSGFTGTLADGDFTFDANSIILNFNEGTVQPGALMVFDIATANGVETPVVLPEPGTILLLATSLTGLGVAGWRRHFKRQ